MTLNNKAAGLLKTRIVNKAKTTFINGVLTVSGNLGDVNPILSDIIFVPE